MKIMQVKWTGIRPLLMHNAQLADKTNETVRAIGRITAKKNKKTDADELELARLEYLGGLYTNGDGRPIIPSDNIERCVQLGAQKQRLGKDVLAAVLCDKAEYVLEYEGPKTAEKLVEDPRYCLRKAVAVQKARVMRSRPMFPTGWSVSFCLEYDETVINERALLQAMLDAGSLVGLGDWRPKFGRFLVEVAK